MYRAWDKQRSKIITPSEARRGTIYFCPSCKKEVTVRALSPSSLVTPYFAHLKHVADQNCENFFPSEYSHFPTGWIQENDHPTSSTTPVTRKVYETNFAKNLYLINQSSWELKLIFTLKPTINRWDGFIDIESTSGTKRIKNVKDEQRLEVAVNFDFSPTSIRKNGNVDAEVWSNLIDNFDIIDPIGGIFNAPFGTGKKLSKGEKLRFGETYVFIPSIQFEFNETLASIIELVFTKNNIKLYQFTIDDGLTIEEIRDIENAFGVEVVKNKPEIKALNLVPLRITADGTYIISAETKELRFECHNKSEIDVKVINGLAEKQVKFDGDYIIVDTIQCNGIEIYWNHYPIIRVSKGNVDFFNPTGIKVEIDDQEFNLLDKNLKLHIPNHKIIKLQSEYLQISHLLKFRVLNSLQNIEVEDSIDVNDDFELDAQAFGYIYFCHNQIPENIRSRKRDYIPNKWLIFSGQLSKNVKEINNTLLSLNQLHSKLNGQGRFHLMKIKNINKLR